jgi:hypothetical protein
LHQKTLCLSLDANQMIGAMTGQGSVKIGVRVKATRTSAAAPESRSVPI